MPRKAKGGFIPPVSTNKKGSPQSCSFVGRVVALCPLVAKITKNYIAREIKGEKLEPLVSYNAEEK